MMTPTPRRARKIEASGGATSGDDGDDPTPATGSSCPELSDGCDDVRLEAEAGKLTPHFLLNSFEAVQFLLELGEERKARQTLSGLGDLLRRQLDRDAPSEQPLHRQLTFVRRYLEVERLRHEGPLELRLDVTEEARNALVPGRLLQPLVENAARHGLAGRPDGGTIEIEARHRGDRLRLRVRDDGRGLPSDWDLEEDGGTGLRAVRAALCRVHGEGHGLEFTDRQGSSGTEVSIDLPFASP